MTQVGFFVDGSLKFSESLKPASVESSEDDGLIVEALNGYYAAIRMLIQETYVGISPVLPRQFTGAVKVYLVRCREGYVLRVEPSDEENSVVYRIVIDLGWQDACYLWSSGRIIIEGYEYKLNIGFAEIDLAVKMRDGEQKPFGRIPTARTFSRDLIVPQMYSIRPVASIAVGSSNMMTITGDWGPTDPKATGNTKFSYVAPVEPIYPWLEVAFYLPEQMQRWRPEVAAAIAERDIIYAGLEYVNNQAEILAQAVHGPRLWFGNAIARLKQLIEDPFVMEEVIHQHIASFPWIFGFGATATYSKMRFGDKVSDFVLRSPDGMYVLVEIERASLRLFNKSGEQSAELRHAINQTKDWVRYVSLNRDTVEREQGLEGISTHPRRLVVIG